MYAHQTDKMKRSLCFAAFITVLFISPGCKKNSTSTPADTLSDIQVDFPTTGTIYINGSTLTVSGTITDTDNLSSAKVEIKNKSTGVVLNQQSSTTGTVSFYRFQWGWMVSGITVSTPATVKITSTDKLGYVVSKQIDVTLDN